MRHNRGMNRSVVTWTGGMAFDAETSSGARFVMDAKADHGGAGKGPSPVEALVASAAACSAMDVVSILNKKKQKLLNYRLEVEWDRGPEGEYPRVITAVRIRHILEGDNLDESAVERSVQLSDEKYCTVVATLRQETQVTSSWEIIGHPH